MLKILTVFGTRPEIIKLCILKKKLDKFFIHKTFFTGQNYDENLSKVFFKELNLKKPNYICQVKNKSLINKISHMLNETEKVIKKFTPDAFLLLGDTNSALTSLVAKKYKIPIFHLEAGNRCFDERVPEEVNRRIVDHISDINLVYTEHARKNLEMEGINKKKIIKTGSPLPEILYEFKDKIYKSKVLKKIKCKKLEYILFSSHREENLDNKLNFNNMIDFLVRLSNEFKNKKIIVSTHPRLEEKLSKLKNKKIKNIYFSKPFSFIDYITLQMNSYCTFSDSGTLTEETALLGTKGIIIRESHERPEGDDKATCVNFDFDSKNFKSLINFIKYKKSQKDNIPDDYKNLNFSEVVINSILSKINFVNKYIYFKN